LGAGVVDYLQSDYLVNKAIFNVPDVCVTGSAAIFACIFMIGMIYKFSTGIENKPNRKLPINLFIDTTQTKCNICLFQEDKVIISFSIKTHNNLTDLIIEHIKKMLKRVGVSSSSIAGIYVVKGPGSFTGVRIGTMIAKTYGLLENKKVFSISALRLQATSNCISILDAKGNKFYTAVFKNNKQVGRVSLKTLNDIEKLAEKYKLPIIQDFHKVNIFENIFLNINNFKLCKNTIRLRPLYIKKPI
jgi:tRNA threonylcarbamoyl adenosine modification protein YeaZ